MSLRYTHNIADTYLFYWNAPNIQKLCSLSVQPWWKLNVNNQYIFYLFELNICQLNNVCFIQKYNVSTVSTTMTNTPNLTGLWKNVLRPTSCHFIYKNLNGILTSKILWQFQFVRTIKKATWFYVLLHFRLTLGRVSYGLLSQLWPRMSEMTWEEVKVTEVKAPSASCTSSL